MKLQGLGNDFLVISVDDVSALRAARELARQMCDRNFGAGADGIVFVTRARHSDSDFASRIFNSDGSEAGISGNGTRCVAAYVYFKGRWQGAEVRINTAAGVKRERLASQNHECFEFEFDMGQPRLLTEAVPMALHYPLDHVF